MPASEPDGGLRFKSCADSEYKNVDKNRSLTISIRDQNACFSGIFLQKYDVIS